MALERRLCWQWSPLLSYRPISATLAGKKNIYYIGSKIKKRTHIIDDKVVAPFANVKDLERFHHSDAPRELLQARVPADMQFAQDLHVAQRNRQFREAVEGNLENTEIPQLTELSRDGRELVILQREQLETCKLGDRRGYGCHVVAIKVEARKIDQMDVALRKRHQRIVRQVEGAQLSEPFPKFVVRAALVFLH